MLLLIESLDKTYGLEMDPEDSINDLKYQIEDREFIPAEVMNLYCGTKFVEYGLIKDNLEELDRITIMLELKGGMRAKWRKKRVRRLKRKRRKMRLRAR